MVTLGAAVSETERLLREEGSVSLTKSFIWTKPCVFLAESFLR